MVMIVGSIAVSVGLELWVGEATISAGIEAIGAKS
jgi:hypothetical protein